MVEWIPALPVLMAFTVAGLVLSFTPGPDMTLFLSRTFAEGRAAGLASLMGASSGILVHTSLAVAGLSTLLAASPRAFLLLKFVGAAYLLWLAFQAIRSGSTLTIKEGEKRKPNLYRSFLTGLGVNILNPKIIFFYVTFLPQFVDASDPYAVHKLAFLGVMFVVITAPPMAVLILLAHPFAETLKRNPMISRTIDWIFASVFAAFAVRIFLTEGE